MAVTSAWAVGSCVAVTRLAPSTSRPSAVATTAPKGPPSSATLALARSTARVEAGELEQHEHRIEGPVGGDRRADPPLPGVQRMRLQHVGGGRIDGLRGSELGDAPPPHMDVDPPATFRIEI